MKIIRFINIKRGQTKKPLRNEKIKVYLANILIVLNNNSFSFKNNVKYIWAKFIKVNKIIKKLIKMIFNNLDLALMQKVLNKKM